MSTDLILALDQGTTSSRALVTDAAGRELGLAQVELTSVFPRSGWVEQDPEAIFTGQLQAARSALAAAGCSASDLAGIGITNQRETTVVWHRRTGQALAPAIVWQDRRGATLTDRLVRDGFGDRIRETTGLPPDAYFSASKLRWLLDNDNAVRDAARAGELAFGTVDSWLLYRLTGGTVHSTDVTNASRTMLFDTGKLEWSSALLDLLEVPYAVLPVVVPSVFEHGMVQAAMLGAEVPIRAVAGDQHAATFGQACFARGMSKNTYGTGCFMLQNTGQERVVPDSGLLGTVAWQLESGATSYAVEGSVFTAGAAIQWLRDGLGLIAQAADVETLARQVPDNGDVYVVPALTGLGAPHWDPAARGTVTGISRGTTAAHLARATLEGIALQVADVFNLFGSETGQPLVELRVDGGAARSDLLLQLQADSLGVPVVRTSRMESTAYGAAFMAGIGAGVWAGLAEVGNLWSAERVFEPSLSDDARAAWLARWSDAVRRSKGWA